MPITKCPVCKGEVPSTLLRSETFPCPTCKEPLRVRDFSMLLTFPALALGWLLTYRLAHPMGLKGYALFFVTFIGGYPMGMLAVGVIGGILARIVPVPLDRDLGDDFADGGVLHIDSPPKPPKGPE